MSQLTLDLAKIVAGGLLGTALTLIIGRINEHFKRTREDQQALMRAALLLLEWPQLPALFSDKPAMDFQREQWRVLAGISEAVGSVTTRAFLPACAAVTRFGLLPNERTQERAKSLAAELIGKANPTLLKEYLAQTNERTAS